MTPCHPRGRPARQRRVDATQISFTAFPLPFALGLRCAYDHVKATCDQVVAAVANNAPMPPPAPKSPAVPAPTELHTRQPKAQKRFAVTVQAGRWLQRFGEADNAHRAIMLSACQQGANFAFGAVPGSRYSTLGPVDFITASQLRLRLPLSILRGIRRCVCGAPSDECGDHLLSCICFVETRKPWHNLIQHSASYMARRAVHHITHDERTPRARAAARTYSPNYTPDFTCHHSSDAGTHLIVDVTTTSTVQFGMLNAAASRPGVVAEAAKATKLQLYGDVRPHVMLPFVVETGGALGADAMGFFKRCRKKVCNELDEESTWSSRGFSNFHLQSISVANLQGQGNFFSRAAGILRGRGGGF